MKVCPFCAEQVQDAAVLCKHCGREIPGATEQTKPRQAGAAASRRSSGATNTARNVVIGVGVLLVLGAAVVQVGRHNVSEAPPVRQFAPPPRIIDIASRSDIDVAADAIEHFNWTVPSDQANCRLTGRIEVLDGGNKDVQVFVTDADEFKNLENGHAAKTFLATDKTTLVNLDLWTAKPGPMVLTISNKFSAVTRKRVALNGIKATCT